MDVLIRWVTTFIAELEFQRAVRRRRRVEKGKKGRPNPGVRL